MPVEIGKPKPAAKKGNETLGLRKPQLVREFQPGGPVEDKLGALRRKAEDALGGPNLNFNPRHPGALRRALEREELESEEMARELHAQGAELRRAVFGIKRGTAAAGAEIDHRKLPLKPTFHWDDAPKQKKPADEEPEDPLDDLGEPKHPKPNKPYNYDSRAAEDNLALAENPDVLELPRDPRDPNPNAPNVIIDPALTTGPHAATPTQPAQPVETPQEKLARIRQALKNNYAYSIYYHPQLHQQVPAPIEQDELAHKVVTEIEEYFKKLHAQGYKKKDLKPIIDSADYYRSATSVFETIAHNAAKVKPENYWHEIQLRKLVRQHTENAAHKEYKICKIMLNPDAIIAPNLTEPIKVPLANGKHLDGTNFVDDKPIAPHINELGFVDHKANFHPLNEYQQGLLHVQNYAQIAADHTFNFRQNPHAVNELLEFYDAITQAHPSAPEPTGVKKLVKRFLEKRKIK